MQNGLEKTEKIECKYANKIAGDLYWCKKEEKCENQLDFGRANYCRMYLLKEDRRE